MMILGIPDDGGNIQKQMQKTTTVQIQVRTGSPKLHLGYNDRLGDSDRP